MVCDKEKTWLRSKPATKRVPISPLPLSFCCFSILWGFSHSEAIPKSPTLPSL